MCIKVFKSCLVIITTDRTYNFKIFYWFLKGLYQKSDCLSFPRKRESITHCFYWMPAFAGITILLYFYTFDTAPPERFYRSINVSIILHLYKQCTLKPYFEFFNYNSKMINSIFKLYYFIISLNKVIRSGCY